MLRFRTPAVIIHANNEETHPLFHPTVNCLMPSQALEPTPWVREGSKNISLDPLYLTFDHSCHWSLNLEQIGNRVSLRLRAASDIQPREELFISYQSDMMFQPYEYRQQQLGNWFDGIGGCACARCTIDSRGSMVEKRADYIKHLKSLTILGRNFKVQLPKIAPIDSVSPVTHLRQAYNVKIGLLRHCHELHTRLTRTLHDVQPQSPYTLHHHDVTHHDVH
jgi:hypothetical protein